MSEEIARSNPRQNTLPKKTRFRIPESVSAGDEARKPRSSADFPTIKTAYHRAARHQAAAWSGKRHGSCTVAVAMGHARDQLREFQNLCALQVQLSDVRGPSSSGAFCLEGAISSAFPCIKFKTEHRQAIYRWTQYLDVAIRLARLYPVVAHPNRTFQLRNSFLRFRNSRGLGAAALVLRLFKRCEH